MLSKVGRSVAYHVETMYLFTASDHKTFVLPQTVFGLFGAVSPLMTTDAAPDLAKILMRLPLVVCWTWLNTFVFVLSNQGSLEAIREDSINKPWRPLAAGRISLHRARQLQLLSIPAVLVLTRFGLGAFEETAVLFCLTWMYNDLKGGEENFIVRNLIIAVAYAFYGSGALRVACGVREYVPTQTAVVWLAMTSAVIFTTMSIQDLKDQPGDRERARHTAPLVIGEQPTRLLIASAILVWSAVCSLFWSVGPYTLASCMMFGFVVAGRVVLMKGTKEDRQSWKLWSYWLIALYGLPLYKLHGTFA